MIAFFNFQRKYNRYKEDIERALHCVFERGWFILGPELRSFEEAFARYLGVEYAIGVNSGTDALFLALKSIGVSTGDEVITVANTAVPTISAIRLTGAMPVFVDVDMNTHVLDPSQLERNITSKTRAILPVHLYGYPAPMGAILDVAKKYGIDVVEDACQAHGAKYQDKSVGTLGKVGCFSFYPTKNLGAFGDAGAIVTNDKQIAEKARAMRNYGEVAKFKSEMEGVNSRLDEVQAAILKWSLDKIDIWNEERAKLVECYLAELSDLPIELPSKSDNTNSRVWHLFVIKTDKRDALQEYLKAQGVETMIHYPTPIHKQQAYSFIQGYEDALPVTTKLSRRILSLPLYPELTPEEVSEICKHIRTFHGR
jgi:dTDP-4-amino-4,6-dideoxygalactose transaminase